MQPVVLVQLAAARPGQACPQHGTDTFNQHERSDNAEKDNETELDDNIDLAKLAEQCEQRHTKG